MLLLFVKFEHHDGYFDWLSNRGTIDTSLGRRKTLAGDHNVVQHNIDTYINWHISCKSLSQRSMIPLPREDISDL